MSDENDFDMCVVCGLPPSACSLVRLTWNGEWDYDSRPEIMIAVDPKPNDVPVCKDCIQQIKRLPSE